MDLSSIITQVPNPSESTDPHDPRSEAADSEIHDQPYHKTDVQATSPAGDTVEREEETPFADNNNASADADGTTAASDGTTGAMAAGSTAGITSTIPCSGESPHDGDDSCHVVPPTGSLNVVPVSPPRTRTRGRARRGGFFRSLLCCFDSSPPESNGPPLEPETNGDLRQRVLEPFTIRETNVKLVTQVPRPNPINKNKDGAKKVVKESGSQDPGQNFPIFFVSTPFVSGAIAEPSIFRTSSRLLGPPRITDRDKKCFIIDLDETLVHSSFKPVENPDFIVPVEIDGTTHQVYVLKRPYVDEFLKRMGQLYECVLFTASLAKYADPVANLLDKWNVFRFRLFREACVFHRGNYVKDLSRLNRDLHKVVILDNSPSSYMFHTDNAVQVISWFDDREDRALLDLIPFFEALSRADSVITFLKHNQPPGMPPFALGYPGQSLTEA